MLAYLVLRAALAAWRGDTAGLGRWGTFDRQFMAEYAEMFYQHLIPQNLVSTAFQRAFGTEPTPLKDALAATIAWYRSLLHSS